jgi:hypothetical protein
MARARATPRTATRIWLGPSSRRRPLRYAPEVKRFSERQRARTPGRVALKAGVHQLARACDYVLREQGAGGMTQAFA